MDLIVLNKDFETVYIIDSYKELIWTDRYYEYGDFELTTPVTSDILEHVKLDYYIVNRDSEHVMIVETILITSDPENGNVITFSGRSLESILDRRVIYKDYKNSFSWGTGFERNVKLMLKLCVLEEKYSNIPYTKDRIISNFTYEEPDSNFVDPETFPMDADEIWHKNLYGIIFNVCKACQKGFKISLNDRYFAFQLYEGKNRSYGQTVNTYVIFSTRFDNLTSGKYMESNKIFKNTAIVYRGEEYTTLHYLNYTEVVSGGKGLDRREIYTDANDEASSVQRKSGLELILENSQITAFEGDVDNIENFKYGEDFFVGDIVQVEDEYGHNSSVRILEVVTSVNSNGKTIYPTFGEVQGGQKI